MPSLHVKKGDRVLVIAGGDRGRTGRVLRVFPKERRALVEGVRVVKKHRRPDRARGIRGGIVPIEAPIHVSNLMVVCPECGRPTRVGHRRLEDGTKVRVCKRCTGILDREWTK